MLKLQNRKGCQGFLVAFFVCVVSIISGVNTVRLRLTVERKILLAASVLGVALRGLVVERFVDFPGVGAAYIPWDTYNPCLEYRYFSAYLGGAGGLRRQSLFGS